MIVLDTNVVSEPLRRNPDPVVIEWLDRQAAETLFPIATSLSGLLVGVQSLPDGRRKSGLAADLAELLDRMFGRRILPFDEGDPKIYAAAVVRARAAGVALSVADGQIAATSLRHDFIVATRDVSPFPAAGATVINPWEDSGR